VIDAATIDDCLPQTQCARCGYPDCRAYADAIAAGDAGIDRCPPGGRGTLSALATVTGLPEPERLADDVESIGPLRIAHIVEEECIGCRKCIAACPVDAIVGTGKMMHTVVAPLCTGCELCLPPCPVDCIALVPPPRIATASALWPELQADAPARFRRARQRHRARLAHGGKGSARPAPGGDDDAIRRQILDAVRRSRNRRGASTARR
jgi:electron transport complex protein RnfB